MTGQQSNLRVILWNAQGLHRKIKELRDFLSHNDIDVLLLQETMFLTHFSYNISNYTLYRNDRPLNNRRVSGGTAIYIKNTIPHTYFNVPLTSLEATSVLIHTIQGDIMLSSAYVKPCENFPDNDFRNLLNRCSANIIAGDMNAHHFAWNGKRNCCRGVGLLKLLLNTHCKMAYPATPTHFYHSGSSTIDLIIYHGIQQRITCRTLQHFTSDHLPVQFDLDINLINKSIIRLTTDWNKFTETLLDVPFTVPSLVNSTDIDHEVERITTHIQNAYKQASKPASHDNFAKLPIYIRGLISKRNAARKTFQTTRCPSDRSTYHRLRADVRRLILAHSRQNWTSYIEGLSANDGSIWRAIRRITNKKTSIPPLKDGNTYCINDTDKANLLARSYSKQFSNDNFDADLQAHQQTINTTVSNFLAIPPSYNIPPALPSEVAMVVHKLNKRKCPGQDKVTNNMLKNIPAKFLLLMTLLTNAIFKTHYFPKAWKQAIVCPIPKPGANLTDPTSYRPISLLSSLSKITERLLLNRLHYFLNTNNLLLPEQFGFREGHSTIHQLIRVVETAFEATHSKQKCAILLLDLQKAFDKVWHQGLIYKLIQHNIPDSFIHIINNYLTNRSFTVRVSDTLSDTYPISSGVPQGSILGPTLFNLYINDIPRSLQNTLALFADDTAVIGHSQHNNTLSHNMQMHINEIVDWMRTWRICINPNKCQALSFTHCLPPSRLHVNNVPIEWSPSVKYLGVTIDKSLCWRSHIKQATYKMAAAYSRLKPLFQCPKLGTYNKTLLFKTYVRPTATYAAPVWSAAARTSINTLESKQSAILRKIRNGHHFLSNITIRRDLDISSMRDHLHHLITRFYDNIHNLPNEILAEIPDYDYRDPCNRKRPRTALASLDIL